MEQRFKRLCDQFNNFACPLQPWLPRMGTHLRLHEPLFVPNVFSENERDKLIEYVMKENDREYNVDYFNNTIDEIAKGKTVIDDMNLATN